MREVAGQQLRHVAPPSDGLRCQRQTGRRRAQWHARAHACHEACTPRHIQPDRHLRAQRHLGQRLQMVCRTLNMGSLRNERPAMAQLGSSGWYAGQPSSGTCPCARDVLDSEHG